MKVVTAYCPTCQKDTIQDVTINHGLHIIGSLILWPWVFYYGYRLYKGQRPTCLTCGMMVPNGNVK